MIGNRRKNRRKAEDGTRLRLPQLNWRRWGVACASIVAIVAVCAAIAWTLDQPIRKVNVYGNLRRVAPGDLNRAVRECVHSSGLVSVDLASVQRAIRQLPWVDSVTVRRQWPRDLRIDITEQVPAARWGETGLLNVRGELFEKNARYLPPELAQLSGPTGKEGVVAQRYLEAQGRLTEAGLRLSALRLDARGAWELDLSNGVTVRLGRRQVDERFNTFMRTAVKLVAQRPDDIAYVDMRYTNGFAVGWRGEKLATQPQGDAERGAHKHV